MSDSGGVGIKDDDAPDGGDEDEEDEDEDDDKKMVPLEHPKGVPVLLNVGGSNNERSLFS